MARFAFALCACAALALPARSMGDAAPPPPNSPRPPAVPDVPPLPVPPPTPSTPPAPADPTQGPPPPRAEITHAWLRSLVGSWDLAIHTGAGDSKGTSRFSLALGGTALVEEMVHDTGFEGLGVHYVTADGKGVRSWWFDTTGNGDMWPFSGSLSEAGYEETDAEPGAKKTTSRLAREGEGHKYEMIVGGQSFLTIRYAKAAKPLERAVVAREKGPKSEAIDALLGDWKIDGVTVVEFLKMEVRHAGTSTFRLGVGGAYILQDYDVQSVVEHSTALAVMSFAPGGAKVRLWSFGNTMDGPLHLEGTVEGTTFKFAAAKTPFGEMSSTWTKKGEGWESTSDVTLPQGKLAVREQYATAK